MEIPEITAPSSPSHNHGEEHAVQLYTDDRHLVDVLARYVGSALTAEHCALIVATGSHRNALSDRLIADGLDVAALTAQRRFLMLDAADTLAQFMVSGRVERSSFHSTIRNVFDRMPRFGCSGTSRIFIFGEMVALLWASGKCEEAIRLEGFWNELALSHSFSLLCAYPIMGLYNETELELFVRACAQHSRVSTSEEYLTEQEMLRSPLEEKFLFGSSQSQDSFFSEKELCFRLMVEAVQERSVFMFDPEGKIRSWNSGAEFMQGYSAEEILGRNVSCLYSDEEIPRERFKLKLAAAIKVGSFEENRWKMRKDGSTFLANITIIPARNADGHVIGFAEITRASHQIHFIDAANSRPRSCRKPFVPRT